jgi:hypothetical protein
MSKIGTLTTGAGVDTQFNLDYTPSVLLIGTVDTALDIDKLAVQVDGQQTILLSGSVVNLAVAKYMMESLLGADVKIAQVVKIANGNLDVKCQITITNGGVATPDVFQLSMRNGNSVALCGQDTLQATSNMIFNGFSALFLDTANLDRAQITYEDGFIGNFSGVELDALFAMDNQSDADGKLNGLTVIDNQFGNILSVQLFSASGGSIQVTSLTL